MQPNPPDGQETALFTPETRAALAAMHPRSRARMRLIGNHGSGRSTALTGWLTGYRARFPETRVFHHRTDGAADRREPALSLWHLLDAIRHQCGFREAVSYRPDAMRETLPNWLARAAAGPGALMIVDGLDGFDAGGEVSATDLLPDYQPPGLSVIVSDDRIRETGGHDWTTLALRPLNRAEVDAAIHARAPGLPTAAHVCTNPLLLDTILAHAAQCPEALPDWLACATPQALFERLPADLASSAGADGVLLAQTLALLWAARDRLAPESLRAALEVPERRWAALAAALSPLLEDGDGHWCLAHRSLRDAIQTRYLRDGGTRQAAHLTLARCATTATDVAWHLCRSRHTDALRQHLAGARVFALLAGPGQRCELHRFWRDTGADPLASYRDTLDGLAGAVPDPAARARLTLDMAAFLREAGVDGDPDDFYRRAQCDAGEDVLLAATAARARGAALSARGDPDAGETLLREARRQALDAAGPDHREAIAATHELAVLLETRGDLAGAETLYREALAAREQADGAATPALLPHLANLAAVLRARHRFDDAEPLCRRALDIARSTLGDEHPTTAACGDQLAAVRYAVGDYEQAEDLYREALHVTEIAFGPHHAATGGALHNMGTVLDAREHFREAEALHRRALAIREALFGSEHEDTATSLHNLGSVLDAMGRYDEAEPLYRRAVTVWERLVGNHHPATATSINNLADLLRGRGVFDEAEQLYRRNLETWRTLLGEEHPNTVMTLVELADLYADAGRPDRAGPLLEHGVEVSRRVMGPTSLVHINAVCKLAALLRDQGQRDAARALLEQACAAAEDTLDMISPRLQKVRRQLEALGPQALGSDDS